MARDRSDIKVTASDALEFEPVESSTVRPKRRSFKGILVTLLAVAVGAGGWALYGDKLLTLVANGDGEVPLIRAENGPVRVRPENPGGLQVPNRDKLVYNRMQGGNQESPSIERLLPRAEAPKPVPTATTSKSFKLPPAKQPKTARVPTLSDVKAVTPPPPPPPAPGATVSNSKNPIRLAKRTTPLSLKRPVLPDRLTGGAVRPPTSSSSAPRPAPAPAARPVAKVTSAPASQLRTALKPASAPTKRASPAVGKAFRVQLAAARTPEAVRAEWDRVRRKNLDLLGDLGLTVTKVDLGAKKGVFFRLRAGPLADDPTARKLCRDLAKRRIGCLVIKPGA
jgi:hypothetical protein